MGFVLDFVIDWFWVGFMLQLKAKHPAWFWTIIAVQLALAAAIIGLVFYFIGR